MLLKRSDAFNSIGRTYNSKKIFETVITLWGVYSHQLLSFRSRWPLQELQDIAASLRLLCIRDRVLQIVNQSINFDLTGASQHAWIGGRHVEQTASEGEKSHGCTALDFHAKGKANSKSSHESIGVLTGFYSRYCNNKAKIDVGCVHGVEAKAKPPSKRLPASF